MMNDFTMMSAYGVEMGQDAGMGVICACTYAGTAPWVERYYSYECPAQVGVLLYSAFANLFGEFVSLLHCITCSMLILQCHTTPTVSFRFIRTCLLDEGPNEGACGCTRYGCRMCCILGVDKEYIADTVNPFTVLLFRMKGDIGQNKVV